MGGGRRAVWLARVAGIVLLACAAGRGWGQAGGVVAGEQAYSASEAGGEPLFGDGWHAFGEREGAARPERHGVGFSRLAVGVDLSTLGFGIEAATPLSPKTNLRLEGNFFDVSQSFSVASIRIGGEVQLRSAVAAIDYQPIRWLGVHITPGLMVYNGNQLIGTATVRGGAAFFPGNGHYTSSPADPVHGSLAVGLGSVAPVLTVGFGNVLPRSGRHWSVPVEAGFAYIGAPSATLSLRGSVCDPNGQNCRAISTAPDVLANIGLEAARIGGDVSFLQVYPIVSIGYVYNFRLRRGDRR
jgi:hypothetical protein